MVEIQCTVDWVVEKYHTTDQFGGDTVMDWEQDQTRPVLTDLVHTVHDLKLSPAVYHATAKL